MLRMLIFTLLLAGCVAAPVASDGEPPLASNGPSSPGFWDCEPGPRIEPDPTSYTVGIVDSAVSFYIENGLEETVAYHSTKESRLDQWYVFIIDVETGKTIAHPDPAMIGFDAATGVDATGYLYGPEILSADENGKWVEYVWESPITCLLHKKHSWIVRYDGLLFGSGWYEDEEYQE